MCIKIKETYCYAPIFYSGTTCTSTSIRLSVVRHPTIIPRDDNNYLNLRKEETSSLRSRSSNFFVVEDVEMSLQRTVQCVRYPCPL